MPKQNFTQAEIEEYKRKQQAEMREMTERIEKGVKDVFSSEKYKDYLKFTSKFTNYSVNNTLLIAMQKPNASLVAPFGKWKELERNINKGEKGIAIFAPVKIKTNAVIETEIPVTDEYGNKQFNDDGTEKTKTVSEPMKQLAFKKVHVFDVSQTNGKPLPNLAEDLKGDIDEKRKQAIISGVKNAVNVPVEYADIQTGSKGFFNINDNKIVVKSNMSDIQTLKTLFHEAAHSMLHNPNAKTNTTDISKQDKEIQAESVAYIVANKYGIDTSEYSFPYIASWSQGKELDTLKKFLNEIQSAAKKLCDNIDKELEKLKDRELNVDRTKDNAISENSFRQNAQTVGSSSQVIDGKEVTVKSVDTEVRGHDLSAQQTATVKEAPKPPERVTVDVVGDPQVPEFETRTYNLSEFDDTLNKVYDRCDNEGLDLSAKIGITVRADNLEYATNMKIDSDDQWYTLSEYLDNISFKSGDLRKISTICENETDKYLDEREKAKEAEKAEQHEDISAVSSHLFNKNAAEAIGQELKALGVDFKSVPSRDNIAIVISADDEEKFKQAVSTAREKANQPQTKAEEEPVTESVGGSSQVIDGKEVTVKSVDTEVKGHDFSAQQTATVKEAPKPPERVTVDVVGDPQIPEFETRTYNLSEFDDVLNKVYDRCDNEGLDLSAKIGITVRADNLEYATNMKIDSDDQWYTLSEYLDNISFKSGDLRKISTICENETDKYLDEREKAREAEKAEQHEDISAVSSHLFNKNAAEAIGQELKSLGVDFKSVPSGDNIAIVISADDEEKFKQAVSTAREKANQPQTKTAEKSESEDKERAEIIKTYFDEKADDLLEPRLAFDEKIAVTDEFFNYEKAWHNVDKGIPELAEKYRNGDDIGVELAKFMVKNYVGGDLLKIPKIDGYVKGTVKPDENGVTLSIGDNSKSYTWEQLGKHYENYLKDTFREIQLERIEDYPEVKEEVDRLLANMETINKKPAQPETAEFKTTTKNAPRLMEQLQKDGIAFKTEKDNALTRFIVAKADVPKYQSAVQKVAAILKAETINAQKQAEYAAKTITPESAVNHSFYNHAAALIEKQLKASGILFTSAQKQGVTTISIAKKDEELFKQCVQIVKDNNTKKTENDIDHSKVNLYQKPFSQAKSENRLKDFYDTLNALKACDKYISENIDKAFMDKNVKGFTQDLEKKFGTQIPMYVMTKAMLDKGAKVPDNNFEFGVKSFKPLENISDKMVGAVLNDMNVRAKELQAKKEEFVLPPYFDDKHLYAPPKNLLTSDERGLPVTQINNNPRFEAYVKGHGWLDNKSFTELRKQIGKEEINRLVEKVKANYIDNKGRVGECTISPKEYFAFQRKTNAPENKQNLEAAVKQNSVWNEKHGIAEKPVEYYSVKHIKGEKYAIVTIGADGTADTVKNDMSKEQASKAMTEIYNKKSANKDNVRIVSPEEFDKMAVKLFQNQTKDERDPEKLFKVLPNPQKNMPETLSHYVQEYKLEGDKYKPVGIAKVGSYDECSKAAQALMVNNNPTFKIYQIKDDPENHGIRFTGTRELAQLGKAPDFRNYEKVYEAPLTDQTKDISVQLENIYTKFNTDRPADFKGHSLSVSDVVVLDKKPYFVDSVGFKGLNNFTPEQKLETQLSYLLPEKQRENIVKTDNEKPINKPVNKSRTGH